MLFNSVILEVAIGLFFIYLVTTLICSGISELIAGLFNLRARRLRVGIRTLLQEDRKNKELTESFYKSPLIKGLFTPSLFKSLTFGWLGSKIPSYIPANVFARVLREVLAGESGTEGLTKDWHEVWQHLLQRQKESKDDPTNEEKKLSAAQLELLGVLKTAGLDGERVNRLEKLKLDLAIARTTLSTFAAQSYSPVAAPNAPPLAMAGQFMLDRVTYLEKAVQQAEKEVNDSLERAQLYVEDYFNQAMDRVSGWYKRNIQIVLVIIAFLVTMLLNIDSLYIVDSLMQAPALRTAVIKKAETYLTEANAETPPVAGAEQPAATETATATAVEGEQPAATEPATAPEATPPAEGEQTVDTTSAGGAPTLATFDELEALGLNLGWDRCTLPQPIDDWVGKNVNWPEAIKTRLVEIEVPELIADVNTQCDPALRPTDAAAMWSVKKAIGMLLTIIAASLGAPFWFDLLNKAVNLRLTGQKPPEKSVTTQNPPTA